MPISVNVYVIHVASFKNRKISIERLESVVRKDERFKFTFRYITECDPENLLPDEIKNSINYDQIKEEQVAMFNGLLKNMHVNQLSNALKHKKALQLIEDSEEVDYSIIIEDDIIFNDDITENLHNILNNLPENFDVMFLGLPASKQDENTPYYQSLKEVFKLLPCCDSYLITKKAATMLNEYFLPIKFQNNIQLSYLFTKLDLETYLSIPNIFIDGSKLGLYFSSLEVNNRLIFNQDYVLLTQLLSKKELTDEDKKEIDKAFLDVKLKTNPEFYYLKALYETKKGNYIYALAIFNYAYDIYESNGAILNNQSTFLRDFMKTFKYLQKT
jgi:GR25 family glycosyltransferase involved in LPS biosynthesis